MGMAERGAGPEENFSACPKFCTLLGKLTLVYYLRLVSNATKSEIVAFFYGS